MCDATMGVLAGVVLMALALLLWQAVKAAWAGEVWQVAGVVACTVATALVVAYPLVMGLLLLVGLCVGAFVVLVGAGSDSYRSGSFWGGYCCFELAGEVLKVLGLVLTALVQSMSDQ